MYDVTSNIMLNIVVNYIIVFLKNTPGQSIYSFSNNVVFQPYFGSENPKHCCAALMGFKPAYIYKNVDIFHCVFNNLKEKMPDR